MDYDVEIMPAALADAEAYVQFLEDEHGAPEYAEQWWDGLIAAFLSLEKMPRRCPFIPERRHFEGEIRHLIYQSHRIIFQVSETKVTILRIYHSARRPLSR